MSLAVLVERTELTNRRLAAPACRRRKPRAGRASHGPHQKHAFARPGFCQDRRRAVEAGKPQVGSGAEPVSHWSDVGSTSFYDPTTGLFLTRDPLVGSTREAYSYVGGSPLNRVDPSGLDWSCITNPGSCDLPIPDSWEQALGSSQQPIANAAGGVVDGIGMGHGDWLIDHLPMTQGKVNWNATETQVGTFVGYGLLMPFAAAGGGAATGLVWTARAATVLSAGRTCIPFMGGKFDLNCGIQTGISGLTLGTLAIPFPKLPGMEAGSAYLGLMTGAGSTLATDVYGLYADC